MVANVSYKEKASDIFVGSIMVIRAMHLSLTLKSSMTSPHDRKCHSYNSKTVRVYNLNIPQVSTILHVENRGGK